MLSKKMGRLLPLGLVFLATGLLLHEWMQGRYGEFTSGFLMGMSLVFMIAGALRRRGGIAIGSQCADSLRPRK